MIRVSAGVIGVFLVALFIAGLSLHAAGWLTWLDGFGALVAFFVAGMPVATGEEAPRSRGVLGGLLSLGLFALWIGGLVARVQPWLVWCTFGAAIAMAAVAFGGGANVPRMSNKRVGASR